MFYSHQLLARKAPLGQIWMAATMHAKINRRKLDRLNIIKICEEILYPSVPMALRLSGILMGGVVIVYERKVKLLYDDVTRLLVEINESWKVKSVDDPTVLPKGKTQAKYEAVTLPDEKENPTIARFQQYGGFRMQLDDLDEPYFNINTEDDDYRHHQADVENITLYNDLDSSLADADLNNRFERFDIEADEEPQFNISLDELVPSPPSREGAEQEVDGIKDHHMEEQQDEGRGSGKSGGSGGIEEQPVQEDKKKMPMKRKGRANATSVIMDNEHLMIPGNIYQSWLHDTNDIVSKRGRKIADFHKQRNLIRSTRISDLLEIPLVPFIPGLEIFPDELHYLAPLMNLLKKGAQKQTTHDTSSGGKSHDQPQEPVSHSPPERFFPPEFSEIGSQTMQVSMEKLRANLENLNFQGVSGEEHTGNSFVTPRSPGWSDNSIPSSGSRRHLQLPLEPVIQPSGRSKRKQNSASTNSLGNLDPVEEDVPMQQYVRDFKLRKLSEDEQTPEFELLEETEPTQTPVPKSFNSSIDKITQSIRTHLKVHFDTPGAPEFESLDQLAFGMNKKKAAQLFYQTCVLATHDFVKVQQIVPYGDISISRGPKM